MEKNIKVTRQLQADVQQQNSQVVFSFASEVPYLRHDQFGSYYEILKCEPQYVDTSRLEDGACQLLLDHDWQRSIGVCKRYWFANKKLYASIKFSRSQFAQGIKRDVLDQIRRNVSIGYIVNDYKVVEAIDGIKTIEVTDWQPYQLTICSVPADPTVGFQRSLADTTNEELDRKDTQMKNAKTNKTDSAELARQTEQVVETKTTDVELENKDLAGEVVETKSEEPPKEAEEDKEKQLENEDQQKEVCPKCGKEPCQCVEKSEGEEDTEEKNCGGEMKPEEKQLEPTAEDLRVALEKSLEADAKEIRELGNIVKDSEAAERFVAEHKTLDQFKTYLKTKDSEKSENSIQDTNKMEKKYFSITKLINAVNNNTVDTESYEYQTNAENQRALGMKFNEREIVLTREDLAFNAKSRAFGGTTLGTPQAEGGNVLIQNQYLPQYYAPNLRPQLTLDKTGYMDIPSPDGRPIDWPVCTGGIQAGVYDLDGELQAEDMKFTIKQLKPKKIGAMAVLPYSLLLQAAPKADAIVEEDLVKALYQVRDEQAFIGRGLVAASGANPAIYEPNGILNTEGVNTVAVPSTGFTWRDMLEAENKIREKNIFSDNLAWVMNGETYVELCSTAKNVQNGFVYGFICEDDKIKNFPVYVNNKIPAGKVILGDFNQLVVTDFDGLHIMIDPYTGMNKQIIKIAGWMSVDCVVQRPEAFTIMTKAGA